MRICGIGCVGGGLLLDGSCYFVYSYVNDGYWLLFILLALVAVCDRIFTADKVFFTWMESRE